MIAYLAARYLPPMLKTIDGEARVAVESVLLTDAPDRLREELDVQFEQAGEDQWPLGEPGVDQGVRALGPLEPSGDHLPSRR